MSELRRHDIEMQLVLDRAGLAASVQDLRRRRSVMAGLAGAIEVAQAGFGLSTRAIDTVARANPIALAAVAAGLAWVVTDRKPAEPPVDEFDQSWLAEADTLRHKARVALEMLQQSEDFSDTRADILADLVSSVREAMARGLNHLTASAQTQILAAREAAYVAQLNARQGIANTIKAHPLATAGVALGLGVVAAAMLSRKQADDRSESDDMALLDAPHKKGHRSARAD